MSERLVGRNPFDASSEEAAVYKERLGTTSIAYSSDEVQAARGEAWIFHCAARKILAGGDGITNRIPVWYLVNNGDEAYDVRNLGVTFTWSFATAAGAKETWVKSIQEDARVNIYIGHNSSLPDSVLTPLLTGTRKHTNNLSTAEYGSVPHGLDFYIAPEAGISSPIDMTSYDAGTVLCDINVTREPFNLDIPPLRIAPKGQLLLMVNLPVANVQTEVASKFLIFDAIKDKEF